MYRIATMDKTQLKEQMEEARNKVDQSKQPVSGGKK